MINKFNIFFIFLVLISISCSKKNYPENKKSYSEQIHKILFGNVNMDIFEQKKEQNEKVYFSPYLVYRPSLFSKESYGFPDTMITNIKGIVLNNTTIPPNTTLYDSLQKETAFVFLDHYPLDTIQLQIPDSLKEVYAYYREDVDIVNDTSSIWFLSPLLPTKEKDVFLIQVYGFRSVGDPGFVSRTKWQYFNKYTIRNDEIKKIERISYNFYSVY